MKHFVQYHNAEERGYRCDTLTTLRILTNKQTSRAIGNTVWLITGEGKRKKRYYLCQRFIVTEAGTINDPKFKYFAKGVEGEFSVPCLKLETCLGFPHF